MKAKRAGRGGKISDTERAIATLYVAITKDAWEKGPSVNEAIAAANDWYYNTYGYEAGAASVTIPKMLRASRGGRNGK